MALLTIDTIISALVAKLGTAVPTYRGGKPDVPRHTGVERFVWTRYTVRPDDTNAGQSAGTNGAARPIAHDSWRCEVECRASTLEKAEHLRAALATAARDELGRNVRLEETEIEPPNADESGWVARVELVIFRPLLRAKLPIVFADDAVRTVEITSVEHDADDAAADDEMEVGEPT